MSEPCPLLESNELYLAGRKKRATLFLPNPYWNAGIMGLLGFMMFVLALVFGREYLLAKRLNSSGKRVNGQVVSTERYSTKSGSFYRVAYSYTVDGISWSRTDSSIKIFEGQNLSSQDPVPVVYLPDRPSQARLGIPGKLWGDDQSSQGWVFLMIASGLGIAGFFGVSAFREILVTRALFREGRVVTGEVVSAESKDAAKGQTQTDVVYRIPLKDGSVLGRAKYVTRVPIRRVRCGESIPVLFRDEETHRPL